jgi:signal transduction histidine kinase/ligand-binding sensor domain-containing protein
MGAGTKLRQRGLAFLQLIGGRALGPSFAALVLACPGAGATQPDLSIGDFQHTIWTDRDGAPANGALMAQTSDGWLWFGGRYGLHRFDGVRFEEVPIDSGDSTRSVAVSGLFALPTGELVIGRFRGGISILKNGKLTHYDSEDTRRAGQVAGLAQDNDGAIWATTENGLLRFDGHTWQLVGSEWGFAGGPTYGIMLDAHGTLWISTPSAVLYLAPGSRKFETTTLKVSGFADFVQSTDSRVWAVDDEGTRPLPGQSPSGTRDPAANSRFSSWILIDREGYFWNLAPGPPVSQWPKPAVTGMESLGPFLNTALEDREGNIWIASGEGVIHRFRHPALATVHVGPAALIKGGLVPDASGKVWIGATFYGSGKASVWIFDPQSPQVPPREMSPDSAIAQARSGTLWVGGQDGLRRRQNDRFEQVLALPESARDKELLALSPDCAGGVWISVKGLGLLRHDGSTWQPNGNVQGLPAIAPIALTCDVDSRLWLGYVDGTVARVDGDRATWFGADEGLAVGAVTSLYVGASHTLVAGDRGLSLWEEGRFVALKAVDHLTLERVTGIVETANGDVWLNGVHGLAHIDAGAFAGSVSSRQDAPIPVELFDTVDGYPSYGVPNTASAPSIALTDDGRLWFAGAGGIASIDPSKVRRKVDAPPLVITSITAGGARHDPDEGSRLAQGTRNLQIDYTALDYSHPERLRFRYRLDGVDDAWVDADTRRQAFYSNLAPRAYRFLVNVTDERGAWTDRVASLDFVIPPTFIQSNYFLVLCIALAIGTLVLAYRLRVRQLEARQRGLLEERLGERERIARELHDTLLQGTQALILRVHAAAGDIPEDSATRTKLDEALRSAEAVMVEGRDRIQDLRASADKVEDLALSLAGAGEELARGSETELRTVVEGRPRALRPDVVDAAYCVGREAMVNAFRHAQARSIELQIIHDDAAFRVRVRDDGVGVDAGAVEAGRPGHWGLQGMRERASRIGAALDIWSRPGAGTEIELRIPAAAAYAEPAKRPRWLPFRLMAGERR